MNRHYTYGWETLEIALGLALGLCAFLGTQKRRFPLALCGVMLIVGGVPTFRDHAGIGLPRTRDGFPAGEHRLRAAVAIVDHATDLRRSGRAEAGAGGFLASYLFVFRSGRRIRQKIDAVDHPDHSHVDR